MPNEYSVEIHDYITQKIAEAEKAIEHRDERSAYYRGQLDELHWMRRYLKENVDLKNITYY